MRVEDKGRQRDSDIIRDGGGGGDDSLHDAKSLLGSLVVDSFMSCVWSTETWRDKTSLVP